MKKDFKSLTDANLTINQAQELMATNGIKMTQIWLRILCGSKKVKSFKIFSSLVIPRTEVHRLISERKNK